MTLNVNQIALLIATIAYLLGLSFSIYEIKIRKRLLAFVILGIVIGSIFVTAVVTLLIETTHYNTPPSQMSLVLVTPIVEELAKILGFLFLWLPLFKEMRITKYEFVRFGGGVGLGFGVFETFSYIALGASYQATISRLLVSVPFHISSAMLIGFGLAEKKSKALLAISLIMAVAFHSLSNSLAIYNALLQGIVFWTLLATLFFLSDTLLVKALKDSGKITNLNELSKTLGQTIHEILPECAEILLKELKSRSSKMLKERRRYHRQIEKRLFKNWKKPMNLLEMFLVVSLEAGDELNKEYRDEANKTNDYVFDVLRRLHARACLTASEILALLKGGFADGAHARWRTLHEIAVISFFIKKHGSNVAKRFLDHEIVESYKQAQYYQKHSSELGYKPLTKEEMQELEKEHNAVLNIYGKDFDGRYGWIPISILRKDKRNFKEIEKSVKLDLQRPYYNMACYNVHSGPKGTKFRLGLVQNDSKKELLLTGPSLFGLADAGQGAAISLYQVTVNLLSTKKTMKQLITMKTMEKLLGEVCSAFYEVHSKFKGSI